MPNFKNFTNGEIDENTSTESTSIRHPNPSDNSIDPRMERLWADDFDKCKSRDDYEKYISKYGKYTSNKYISQAQDKLKAIDAEDERKRKEEESKEIQDNNSNSNVPKPKPNNMGDYLFWVGLIAIVFGIFFLSQNSNGNEQDDDDTDTVIIDPTPAPDPLPDPDPAPDPDPEPRWISPCICNNGRCGLCGGDGKCGQCYGLGSIYQYPNDYIDCPNCGGSGYCQQCDGSGICPYCDGKGETYTY
jgi:hypothetical protein